MVSALVVGNSILKRAFSDKISVTPMKLQKLIYFVYADYYQSTNSVLFEEPFETWKYGPVLRSVYDAFKSYGANPISQYACSEDGSIYVINEQSSPYFKKSLDTIWKKFGKYDGVYLSSLTHKQGTAWWKAATKGEAFLSREDILEDKVAYE